jgi:glyoxylase-like metal-dependent hydrolase (beta-lactamase superfamily II)
MQFKQWKIGKTVVTKIVEMETVGRTRFVLPQATPDEVRKMDWLEPHFAEDGRLKMSIHALVVDTGKRKILVDTCIGNDKQSRSIPSWNQLNTPFLQWLTEAGYPPASIDTVFCTHLHVDHVGWNTKLEKGQWVPTFPKARYIFGHSEYNYWRKHQEDPAMAAVMADSVMPVVDAGLVDFVQNGDLLCEEVSVFPTPGHSPGHLSVRVRSAGEEGMLIGDVAHHPCQMAHLDWASTYDTDAGQSTHTRRELFSYLASHPTLVIGGHFNAGRVLRDGRAFRFEIAN